MANASDYLISPPRAPSDGTIHSLPDHDLTNDRVAAEQRVANFAKFAVPSAIAGTIDSLTSGIGLTSDSSVQKWISEYVSPEFGSYYGENRNAAVAVGTLATLPLAGLAATKVIQGGGFLYRTIQAENNPVLRGVFTSGMTWGDVAAKVKVGDAALATNGVLDASRGVSAMLRSPASRQALGTVAMDSIKNSLAFEAGVFAFHHGNQIVYPDDQSLASYFAINGGFAVGALGIDLLIARKIMANSLQSVAREAHAAIDVADTKAIKDVLISRPNERGVGITQEAMDIVTANAARRDPSVATPIEGTQNALGDSINNLALEQEKRLMGTLEAAAADGFKLGDEEIIARGSVPVGATKTLFRHLTDPKNGSVDSLVGLYAFQGVPQTVDDMQGILQRTFKSVDSLIEKDKALTANYISAVGTPGETKALQALDANALDMKRAKEAQFFVFKPTGDVINASRWTPTAYDHPELFAINSVGSGENRAYSLKLKGLGAFKGEKEVTVTPSFDIIVPQKAVVDAQGNSGARSIITDFRNEATLVNDPDVNSMAIYLAENNKQVIDAVGATLSAEQASVMREWTGSSQSTLRQWYESRNAVERLKFDEIFQANEPIRELLRQAGIRYVTLFRGAPASEATHHTNTVMSFAADPRVAKTFARKHSNGVIYKINVPVENIVGLVKGLPERHSKAGRILVDTTSETEWIIKDAHLIKPGQTVLHEAGWGGLNAEEVSAAFMLYDHAVQNHVVGRTKIKVDPFNDHWTKLDALTELLQRKPDAITDLDFGTGNLRDARIDVLQWNAMKGKYAELADDLEKRHNILSGPINLRSQVGELEQLAAKYNLPMAGLTSDNSNIFQALVDLYTSTGLKNLDQVASSFDEFKDLLKQNQAFNEVVPAVQQGLRLRGNNMNLWRDAQGNVLPSVLVAQRPVPYESLTRKNLTEWAETQRDVVMSKMRTAAAEGATLVQAAYDSAGVGSGTFRTAQQADTLIEGVQTGGGIFGAQRRTLDVNPAYQAGDGLDMLISRGTEREVEAIFSRHNRPIARVLEGSEADKFQFGRFAQTQSAGWQFKNSLPVDLPNVANLAPNAPRFGFVLDETSELTQKIWKQYFPNKSIDDAVADNGGVLFAPDMIAAQRGEYIPLAVNQLAAEGATAFHSLGLEVLRNKNKIRELMGKAPLNERSYHMPPPDFVSPNTLFVVYPDGRSVIATGRTPAEATAAANRLRDSYSNPSFVKIVNKEALRQHAETMDDVFWRMVDPSDPLVAGGPNRGGFFMPKVPTGDGFIRGALDSINEELQSIIYRSRSLLFEPQINYANLMHGVSGIVKDKKSIFETYTAKLTGSSPFSPQSPISRVYKGMESGYDAIANKLFGMFINQESGRPWSKELLAQVGNMKKQSWHDTMYRDLQTSGYNPYGSMVDMMESQHEIRPPKSLASHAAKFNNTMSLLMLRFMDFGNALVNLTSLGANMPAVTRALKKIPGETNDQWATRIGWFASPLNDDVAFLNPTRLVTSTIHDMFTAAGRADMDLLKQYNQISSITHEMMRTKFDPSGVLETGKWTKFMSAATWAVDKSEEMARTTAMMAGLRIGRAIDRNADPADLVAFAGRYANDIIADYRPHNRPQIFSGAVGMPLGLFQTYAWNYFERLFGYISDRNLRGLAVQGAMQTALFGAESLPGFKQFQDIFTENMNAASNPVDNLRKRYGELAADFFLYGSISNLPRLFGTGDGLSLFTRADSNFRGVPTVFTPNQSAAYSLLESIGKTIGAEVAQFQTGGQFSLQQTLEAVGTYFPNRYIKRMTELWTGASVDERGQLISDDVRGYMSIFARNMGLRTLKEQREIEAYLRTRSIERSQAAIRDRASDSLRALLRGGDLDTDKAVGIARDYVKQGGDPRNVGTFFRNQVLAALVERDDRALATALRGGRWDNAMRLLSAYKDDD